MVAQGATSNHWLPGRHQSAPLSDAGHLAASGQTMTRNRLPLSVVIPLSPINPIAYRPTMAPCHCRWELVC